jgi:hypothetical protein
MWVNLLNTPVSQASLTPDEFGDVSPLHRRSSVSSTPHPQTLFQPPPTQQLYPPIYQYPPYSYPPLSVGGSSGGNASPPYPYPPPLVSCSSDGNAPPPYPYHPPPPYCYLPYSYIPPPTGGLSDGPTPQSYLYPPPPAYLYPPPQPVRSGGGDNSDGGENTSHTTQAHSRMKKRNEWIHDDEKNVLLLIFCRTLFDYYVVLIN